MFLKEISDDFLVCLYREGVQWAIDLLFERYTVFLYGFIHQIMKQNPKCCEYSEIFQEVMVLFIGCIGKYDEYNGCFYFFVKISVERKIYNYLSRMKKIEKISSLDDRRFFSGNESNLDYIQEDDSCQYYETDLYRTLEERLDSVELKIVDYKVEGYTYQEISKLLGVNKQLVYRKVVIIKNIIKDIIEKID